MNHNAAAILVIVGLVLFTALGSGWGLFLFAILGMVSLLAVRPRDAARPNLRAAAASVAAACAVIIAVLVNRL